MQHLKDFFEYLVVSGLAERTVLNYRDFLKIFTEFLEKRGIDNLLDLSGEDASAYQNYVFDYISRFHRPLTISSQISYLNAVKVLYGYFVNYDFLSADPTVSIRMPKEHHKLPKNILSSAEIKKLFSQINLTTPTGYRDRTIFELSYSCGLRITELIDLKITDFNKNLSELRVFGKGSKTRVVPVGKNACFYLNEYICVVRKKLAKTERKLDNIFISKSGQKWCRSGMIKMFKKYAKRAKITKKVTPHTFRHTLATEMLKNGADLRYIQQILGHEKLRTTQIYLQLTAKELGNIHEHTHPREQIKLPENSIKFRK